MRSNNIYGLVKYVCNVMMIIIPTVSFHLVTTRHRNCTSTNTSIIDISILFFTNNWFIKLGTQWGFKWILTEDFKFWIKPNILTWEAVKIFRYENKLLMTMSYNIVTSSHQRCSPKKLLSKISQYSQKNTCVGKYLQSWTLLTRDSC